MNRKEGMIPFQMVSSEELGLYTDNFSEENFIGKFQFGKLYHGKMKQREVMVKVYEDSIIYNVRPDDIRWQAEMEVGMLDRIGADFHPALMEGIGLCNCNRERMGIVYDFKPLDTLYNLLLRGSFAWLQRIKVALQLSSLLECLHYPKEKFEKPLLVCNISAAHIMLDQDSNVKLIDYSMSQGGISYGWSERLEGLFGCYGYIDPTLSTIGCDLSVKVDVFAFGVLLLELIAKRVYDPDAENFNVPLVHEWAQTEYNSMVGGYGWSKRSLVHQSLEADPDFDSSDGHKITRLAMRCVNYCPKKRPTMRKVVDSLLDLHVVRHNADLLGIEQLDRGRDPELDKLERYEEIKYRVRTSTFFSFFDQYVRKSICRSRLWQAVESAKDHLHCATRVANM